MQKSPALAGLFVFAVVGASFNYSENLFSDHFLEGARMDAHSETLMKRLNSEEDNLVERKPDGVKAGEIRQTVVAFANTVPPDAIGLLFIGVGNRGEIQGVQNADKLQKTIREQCENVCYPPIAFSCSVIPIDGASVLAVEIPSSKNRPHFSGPAYVRRGSESVSASPTLFDELVASRIGKVGAILNMRGAPVTVICRQHKLGSSEYVADKNYRTRSDCLVENCDPHTLRLKDIASDRYISEPLDNVSINFDEERRRPMLIVSGS